MESHSERMAAIAERVEGAHLALDFKASERIDKARKIYTGLLIGLVFVLFANIEFQTATIAITAAKIGRPPLIRLGLWAAFLYQFFIYVMLFRYEARNFYRSTRRLRESFYVSRLQQKLNELLTAALGHHPFGFGGSVTTDGSSTVLKLPKEHLAFLPDALANLPGFDSVNGCFTYQHTDEDEEIFERIRKTIPVGLSYNFFVYDVPALVGAGFVGFGLASLAYFVAPWPQLGWLRLDGLFQEVARLYETL